MLAILGAFSPEVEPFDVFLAPRVISSHLLGVGLVESAIATAWLLERVRPSFVLFVGTAGVFPEANAELLGLYAVDRVTLVSSPDASLPGPMPRELQMSRLVPNLPRASVATTLGITTKDDLAHALYRESACALEHLELFSVASACAKANVPCAAVLGVTNVVGSLGRAQWSAHHRDVSKNLASVVGPQLANLV